MFPNEGCLSRCVSASMRCAEPLFGSLRLFLASVPGAGLVVSGPVPVAGPQPKLCWGQLGLALAKLPGALLLATQRMTTQRMPARSLPGPVLLQRHRLLAHAI